MRAPKPSSISRHISPAYAQRASKVPAEQTGPYLDAIASSLHQALDGWRFKGLPPSDVSLALDAFNALWAEVELRNR